MVAARFDGRPEVEEVSTAKIAERIFRVTNVARNIMLVFILLLGVVGVLHWQHHPSVYLRAASRSGVLKLVGATNWFILAVRDRGPWDCWGRFWPW